MLWMLIQRRLNPLERYFGLRHRRSSRPSPDTKTPARDRGDKDGSGGRMAFGHCRICLRRFAPQLLLPLIATHASLRLRVNLLSLR